MTTTTTTDEKCPACAGAGQLPNEPPPPAPSCIGCGALCPYCAQKAEQRRREMKRTRPCMACLTTGQRRSPPSPAEIFAFESELEELDAMEARVCGRYRR